MCESTSKKDPTTRHIQVSCAIIERDGLILAAQRSALMSMPWKWEFPGGKIDPGESSEHCLRRELIEELGIHVVINGRLAAATHHYPAFTITLHPFICLIESGEMTLHEHAAVCWLKPDQLPNLDWTDADLPVLKEYYAYLQQTGQEKNG